MNKKGKKINRKRKRARCAIIPEKQAVKEMRSAGAYSAGIKIMRDKAVFRIIKLNEVKSPLANIIKENMLSAGGDAAVHKLCCACLVDYTDVVLMGTIEQYKYLLKRLGKQPYGGVVICKILKKVIKV